MPENTYEYLLRLKRKCSPPVKNVPQLRVRPFGPYEDAPGVWKFSKGLLISLPMKSGDPSPELYTMETGDIQFKPGLTPQSPGTLFLLPGDATAWAITREVGFLPSWYPVVSEIRYSNVDPISVRTAVKKALSVEKAKARALMLVKAAYKDFDPPASKLIDTLVNIWLTGTWEGRQPENTTQKRIWLKMPIEGGTVVGTFSPSATETSFETEITMAPHFPAKTYLNPAYYLARWQELGWIGKNDLALGMSGISGPPAGTGRMLFVSSKVGGQTGPFDTAANPSKTISAALIEAISGDTVVVLDQEIYNEPVLLTKPVSLVSAGTKTADQVNPDYPTIDGNKSFRPVTFAPYADGMFCVSKFIIARGAATGDRKDGGGILVEQNEEVVISNCVVSECEATGSGIFGEGFGGGIAAYHSSPAIIGCRIVKNKAKGRGNGIGVFGFGWPAIYGCTIELNSPYLGGLGNARLDGGGIATQIGVANKEGAELFKSAKKATLNNYFDETNLQRARWKCVRVIACNVRSNVAYDDGGGIYVTARSFVLARGTTVAKNASSHDGGGFRVTMHSKLLMFDCDVIENESNAAKLVTDEAKYGGGGISCRNSEIGLYRVRIVSNKANGWGGGGVYFISSDEGEIKIPLEYKLLLIPEPDFDWNDVLLSVYGFKESRFFLSSGSKIENNEATFIIGQSGNHGKGGALYLLRYQGKRHDPDVSPQDITAKPLIVEVEDVASIGTNSDAANGSARILLRDEVVLVSGKVAELKDANLPPSGTFVYPA